LTIKYVFEILIANREKLFFELNSRRRVQLIRKAPCYPQGATGVDTPFISKLEILGCLMVFMGWFG
jgi:hypothetical protein